MNFRVSGRPTDLVSDGGEHSVLRMHDVLPDVEEHEAAGAVGALGHAGPPAALPHQRRLLVTQHARNRHAHPLAAGVLKVAIDLGITKDISLSGALQS